jgi:hypothetical protein
MISTTVAARPLGLALGLVLLFAPRGASQEFPLRDNSFFIEEAFNQEPGKVQTKFRFFRVEEDTELRIDQEWPLRSQRRQLSFTLPFRANAEEELFRLTAILRRSPGRGAPTGRRSGSSTRGSASAGSSGTTSSWRARRRPWGSPGNCGRWGSSAISPTSCASGAERQQGGQRWRASWE